MAIIVLEEVGRVEVSCDGCGRVVHVLEVGDYEGDNFESLLVKIGNFSYCSTCEPHHTKRFEEEQNSYAAKHLAIRETETDSEELEKKLAALDEEHGITRPSENT